MLNTKSKFQLEGIGSYIAPSLLTLGGCKDWQLRLHIQFSVCISQKQLKKRLQGNEGDIPSFLARSHPWSDVPCRPKTLVLARGQEQHTGCGMCPGWDFEGKGTSWSEATFAFFAFLQLCWALPDLYPWLGHHGDFTDTTHGGWGKHYLIALYLTVVKHTQFYRKVCMW